MFRLTDCISHISHWWEIPGEKQQEGREGGLEGVRTRGREGVRAGGREGWREGGTEGMKEGDWFMWGSELRDSIHSDGDSMTVEA